MIRANGNKYHAKRTKYNGVAYDSKAEAARAAELDLLVKSGAVTYWLRQVTFRLGEDTTWKADFVRFTYMTVPGLWRVWVEEVKAQKARPASPGVKYRPAIEGREFPKIRKLWPKYGPFPLIVYYGRKANGWKDIVRIDPGEQE